MQIPSLGIANDSAVLRDQYRAVVGTVSPDTDVESIHPLPGHLIGRVKQIYTPVPGGLLLPDDVKPLPRQQMECVSHAVTNVGWKRGDILWFEYGRGALFTVGGVEYIVLKDADVVASGAAGHPESIRDPNLFVRVVRSPDYARGSDVILTPRDKSRYYEEGVVTHTPREGSVVEVGQHIVFEYAAGSALRIGDEVLRCIDKKQIWGVLE